MCRHHPLPVQRVYSKRIIKKYLTLKMKVKVTEYNIHNGPIRWQMSTSIKSNEHFSLALIIFEIFIFQNSWSGKCRSRSGCTTFAVALFDDKCLTSYLIVIVMFAFFSVYLSKYRLEKFDLENLGQGHGEQFVQWCHSMANVKNSQTSRFLFCIFARVYDLC